MAHSTRSQSQKTTVTAPTASHDTSQVEFELLHKQLDEREKMIREQANALRREREEFDKYQMGTNEVESIMQTLKQLQTDITHLKYLPEKIQNLEYRVNESSQPQSLLLDANETIPVNTSQMFLKIKDVIPNIPNYDGYKMSVFQFSRACERARDLLPPAQEPQLVQLIINKLEGDAYQVIEGNYYDTVTGLLDKLKTIFAPCKSVSQYRGELVNIYNLPNETVLKYAGRIKDLKTAIIDCYRRQKGVVDKMFLDEIDNEVLEAFVNGLPSDLITRIEHRPIHNLDLAIEWAIKLSHTMEVEKARARRNVPRAPVEYRPSRADSYYSQFPAPRPMNQPTKILTRPPDAVRPFIRPLIPGVPGPNSPNVCRYCKFPGHDISACKKLAYRNAQQNSGNARGDLSAQGAGQGIAQNIARPVQTSSQPGPSHEKIATVQI